MLMYVPSFTFKSRFKLGNNRTLPLEKLFFLSKIICIKLVYYYKNKYYTDLFILYVSKQI